mmetsp:Transcript_12288/g.26508  ORF Transcript_12288/g.26508 Transcript_12288/m.26508 type:complete len:344 (-) Transcript_12288:392-1423(-)
MATIKVALDWTPNTNHTGFYVAKSKGYYKELGLEVEIISPHVDEYKATPASRVVDGSAMFSICPSESVISHHSHPDGKPKIQAVAALLSNSTSAVVTLKNSGLDRPSKLDGKTYASYGARYEGRIVQQMIKNDGGRGVYIESTPPMLGIWNTLLKGQADATWVFLGWEGIEAQQKGVELNVFKLEDYKVPYGYSPVLVAHPSTLSEQADRVSKFLQATARGYQHAAQHPEEAAEELIKAVKAEHAAHPLPEELDAAFVKASQAYTSQHYLDAAGKWGHMDEAVWSRFLDWLSASGLLTSKVQSRTLSGENYASLDGLRQGDVGQPIPRESLPAESLFTNAFLP